jgi:hypothetical protein
VHADFVGMARGKAFVDVLDEVLAGYEGDDDGPSPRVGCFATPSIFRLDPVGMKRSAASVAWLSTSVTTPTSSARLARPHRRLSPRQREAFNAFVQLGASISDDFTDEDLRSMYRSLALRYHPDRHPRSSDSERAHLSVCFSQLTDAYESLKSVPVCPN